MWGGSKNRVLPAAADFMRISTTVLILRREDIIFSKHGRRFVCYSYICFYSFIPRFQQIQTRTNTRLLLVFVFIKQGFLLDEYLFWKTNIKFKKQIFPSTYFLIFFWMVTYLCVNQFNLQGVKAASQLVFKF